MRNLPSVFDQEFSLIKHESKKIKTQQDTLIYHLLITTNLIDFFKKENRNFIKAWVPQLNTDQKKGLVLGSLEFIQSSKDDTFFAVLRDRKTKKIIDQVNLKEVNIPESEVSLINDLILNIRLNKLIDMMNDVYEGINNILRGLHNDRLAKSKSVYSQYLTFEYLTDYEKELLFPHLLNQSSEAFFQISENLKCDLKKLKKQNNLKDYLSSKNQDLADSIFLQLEAIVYATMVRQLIYQNLNNKIMYLIPINDLNIFIKQNIKKDTQMLLNEWTNNLPNFWTKDFNIFKNKLNLNVKEFKNNITFYLE